MTVKNKAMIDKMFEAMSLQAEEKNITSDQLDDLERIKAKFKADRKSKEEQENPIMIDASLLLTKEWRDIIRELAETGVFQIYPVSTEVLDEKTKSYIDLVCNTYDLKPPVWLSINASKKEHARHLNPLLVIEKDKDVVVEMCSRFATICSESKYAIEDYRYAIETISEMISGLNI